MAEGGKEKAKHPLANLPEKHRKIFTIGYLAIMGAIFASGIIANFFHEKSNSK